MIAPRCDLARLAHLIADLPVEVRQTALGPRDGPRSAPPNSRPRQGRPRMHGAPFALARPTTWGDPQTETRTDTTRYGTATRCEPHARIRTAAVARAVGSVAIEGPYDVAHDAEFAGRIHDWAAEVADGRPRHAAPEVQMCRWGRAHWPAAGGGARYGRARSTAASRSWASSRVRIARRRAASS
uniref:Uncharacterized protein n=1 Tax=Streptomyces sp. NBC_00119 TaxID=2975659 RepID=A0AAU1UPG3_9ACTN